MRLQPYWPANGPGFAADYRAGVPSVLERFDYDFSRDGLRERARWLDDPGRPQAPRKALVEALRAYNLRHNDTPEVRRSLEKLERPEALAVVGGQQAGLFTGPLLAIYKAMTLIQCAEACERLLGRPVVPVFWIAGEDHDWDEVNHTYVLNPLPAVVKIAVRSPAAGAGAAFRPPVSRTAIAADDWLEAVGALEEAVPDTEFKGELMDRLRSIVAGGDRTTLTAAFARILSQWFGRRGLVLLDSDDPPLRRVEAEWFAALIRRNGALRDAIRAGEAAVARAGYPLQAPSSPDATHLFYVDGEGRKPLFLDPGGDGVSDRKGTLRMTWEQLERRAAEEPENLSNAALSRPAMQDYLLPTLAAVLGPSEIAYWGVLKEAFHTFGLRLPVVVPRLAFTLVEGTVRKQMEKFGVAFAEAAERLPELRDRWLKAQDELGLERRFDEVKRQFAERYRALVETAAAVNPGLGPLGETNLRKIEEQIDFFRKKTMEALKVRHEAGLRQWERIRLTLSPNGKPQERVLNVYFYLVRYGPDWLDRLLELPAFRPDREAWTPHWVVYL